MNTKKKQQLFQRRHWRARKKITGTGERPRMSVRFTGKNIYVQFVDDTQGRTLASASTAQKSMPDRAALKANIPSAEKLGEVAARQALEAGIKSVVFDRGGARFHGKVKALADAARNAGLHF